MMGFLLSGTSSLLAQDFSEQRALSLSTTYSGILNGVNITPSYVWEKEKKTLSIGPTILWSTGDQIETRDKIKLSGIQATYQAFPFRSSKKLNLFILGDLLLQRVKDQGTSVVFNATTGSFDPFEFSKTDNTIQLYLGYGLDWALGDNYVFTQSIGLGTIFTSRSTQSGFEDFSDKFLDTDWTIKMGIRRRF